MIDCRSDKAICTTTVDFIKCQNSIWPCDKAIMFIQACIGKQFEGYTIFVWVRNYFDPINNVSRKNLLIRENHERVSKTITCQKAAANIVNK